MLGEAVKFFYSLLYKVVIYRVFVERLFVYVLPQVFFVKILERKIDDALVQIKLAPDNDFLKLAETCIRMYHI